jgi:Rrf2 family protein
MENIMKITKDVDYAIRTILYLSIQKDSYSATKFEISEKMQIPHQFLAKIAQQLHRSRIIEITKGPKGMYRLIKKPEDITLLDIFESIKGEILLNYCVSETGECFRKDRCYVNKIWNDLSENIRNYLSKINFQEIAEKEVCYLE